MARAAVRLPGASAAIALDAVTDVVRATVAPVAGAVEVAVEDIAGRTLAGDLPARTPVPPFDHSAVEGFAFAAGDASVTTGFRAVPPWTFPVMAGEPVPAGADRVAARERCRFASATVEAPPDLQAGANIRRVGEDVAPAALLARSGARLDARHAALFMAAGHRLVPCLRSIRVALLTVTEEGVGARLDSPPGSIHESVRPMLRGLLAPARDLEVVEVACARSAVGLSGLLDRLAREFDLIVASGDASYDGIELVRRACLRLGGRVAVDAVAMRPGRPVRLASLGTSLLLFLPGSPFAALVGFLVLGRPILARMRGLDPTSCERPARAGFFLDGPRHRAEIFPAGIMACDSSGAPVLECLGKGGSGRLAPLIAADGLGVIKASASPVHLGDPMSYLPFDTARRL